jgi:hypothetical protein
MILSASNIAFTPAIARRRAIALAGYRRPHPEVVLFKIACCVLKWSKTYRVETDFRYERNAHGYRLVARQNDLRVGDRAPIWAVQFSLALQLPQNA